MATNSDQIAVYTRAVSLWSKGLPSGYCYHTYSMKLSSQNSSSSLRENVTSKCPLRAIMYKGGSMEISVETVTADGIYQNIPLNLQRVYHYEAVNTLVLWTPLIYFRGGGRGCEL